jgi:hypothetical protein
MRNPVHGAQAPRKEKEKETRRQENEMNLKK